MDVIPLPHAADLLITDASSVSSEYSLLDRPMVFLDTPKLLSKAIKKEGSMADIETWGHKGGVLLSGPEDIVQAVGGQLSQADEFGEIRQAMAADLFYNPGTATDAAWDWVQANLLRQKV